MTNPQQRILVIDKPQNIELLVKGGLLYFPIEMSFATTKRDALASLNRHPADLIVAGLEFDDGTAVDLIHDLKQGSGHSIPGIYLTEASQQNLQQEVLKLGAIDVLPRPFEMSALHRKLEHAVHLVRKYRKKTRLESFIDEGQAEFEALVKESQAEGIPVTELLSRKQVSK